MSKKQNKPLISVNGLFSKINLNDLPSYFKLNALITTIIAVLVILTIIPETLEMIENIIISIGNIVIRAKTNNEILPRTELSNSKTQIFAILSVIVESLICLIICIIAKIIIKKKNSTTE